MTERTSVVFQEAAINATVLLPGRTELFPAAPQNSDISTSCRTANGQVAAFFE
ncbi:hypothetical protein [Dactylosporangium sp. NPDC048998]|uniref:hypothetical protein n=1 Tax=Dactylosporangium sp. NPDC048998 TaxID=3363976 RepID=UPI00371BBFFA